MKSRWLGAVKNHCKASKIHSSGDMRPGHKKGKVRKTDECVGRSLPGYFERRNPCEWCGNAICRGFWIYMSSFKVRTDYLYDASYSKNIIT